MRLNSEDNKDSEQAMWKLFVDDKFSSGVSAAATAIGSVLVLIGLVFTSCQIKSARETIQATMLYNVEKDFSDIFSKRVNSEFLNCFGSAASAATLDLPKLCGSPAARETLFDVLSFYRLLLDLEKKDTVDSSYVNARIRAFCEYLTSKAAQLAIEDFDRKGIIRADLQARIKVVCSEKK